MFSAVCSLNYFREFIITNGFKLDLQSRVGNEGLREHRTLHRAGGDIGFYTGLGEHRAVQNKTEGT